MLLSHSEVSSESPALRGIKFELLTRAHGPWVSSAPVRPCFASLEPTHGTPFSPTNPPAFLLPCFPLCLAFPTPEPSLPSVLRCSVVSQREPSIPHPLSPNSSVTAPGFFSYSTYVLGLLDLLKFLSSPNKTSSEASSSAQSCRLLNLSHSGGPATRLLNEWMLPVSPAIHCIFKILSPNPDTERLHSFCGQRGGLPKHVLTY